MVVRTLLAAVVLVATLWPASAEASLAVSSAGGFVPVAVAPRGGPLLYVNADLAPHNLVAADAFRSGGRPWCQSYPADGCPLFWSELIGPGVTPVEGLEDTPPGTYGFYCEVHPAMRGTLVVLEAP